MSQFQKLKFKGNLKTLAERIGYDAEVHFPTNPILAFTKFFKVINEGIWAWQSERRCIEKDGILPIMHTLDDLKNFMTTLELTTNIFLNIRLVKSASNDEYLVQWPDGLDVYKGPDFPSAQHQPCINISSAGMKYTWGVGIPSKL